MIALNNTAPLVQQSARLAETLLQESLPERWQHGPVSDALTYADQTVGPWGRAMTINDRIAEAITRHGPDSPTGQAHTDRGAYLLAVADRVEHRRSSRPIIPNNPPSTSDPPPTGFTSSG